MSDLGARLAFARAIWNAAEPDGRLELLRYAALTALHEILGTKVDREMWIPLGGVRFCVMPGRGELSGFATVWLDREYESLDAFRPRRAWLVVDVGANVGFYAVLQASRGARVIAIEPNPSARSRLERTVAANGLAGLVETVPVAIGTVPGRARLFVGRSTQTASTGGTERGVVESYPVDVVRLDDALPSTSGRIDLVKVDVEADVVDVLRSGPRVLSRTERVVLEYHTEAHLGAIGDLFADRGFVLRLKAGFIAYFERAAAISP